MELRAGGVAWWWWWWGYTLMLCDSKNDGNPELQNKYMYVQGYSALLISALYNISPL